MNVRNFVGTSSLILLAWLGVTYFHEVPFDRYPEKVKIETSVLINQKPEDTEIVAVAGFEESENY